MSELKDIVDCIKKKDLDKGLQLCDFIENKNNKHIILNLRGVIYLLKNNLDLAESNFLDSIKIKNNFEDPIKNLYLFYLKKNNYKDVLIYAKKLIEIDKLNHQYNFQLAYALDLNNDPDGAINSYKNYLDIGGKDQKKALNNIGSVYLKKNKPKIALDYLLKAINFGEDKIVLNNTLNCYIKLRDKNNSDIFFNKSKEIDENFIEFIFNKAEYLIFKNEINEAIKILEDNKDKPKFLITLLRLYFITGQNELGNNLLIKSKNQIKNNPEFYNYLGIRSLYEGNFEDGWKYYEFRNSKRVDLFKNIQEWTGQNIEKKNIVVFNEQGLGDTIQFSKYLIPLTKIAENVTFVVQDNIKKLFKKEINNLSIETLQSCKDKKFDFKIALGSLIQHFYKEKIDPKDYLVKTDETKNLKWKKQISNSKLNIGIVWSGSFNGPNEPYRSVPLKIFERLFSLNANFYCLQNEIWESDYKYFKSLNLIDFGKHELNEIASIIQNLDFVITVDTSLLHLSASLGKETWGILSLYPDWRWGKFDSINSYSTLKIFRQKKFDNWNDVESEIYSEVSTKIEKFNK